VTTYSSSPALFVPNTATVTDTITVPDTGTVNSVTVNLTLRHPQTADVQIRVTDPSGLVSVLVFNRDGGVGDGLYDVTFDDTAGGPPPGFLTNGQCLTNASFTPSEPLSGFAGVQINGGWTIAVSDVPADADASDCDCDGLVVGPSCPRTLDSWSLTLDYFTNQAPVALCQDVTVAADEATCAAAASVDDGSSDPDGDALTLTQDPPGPYGLGATLVTLTATDPDGLADDCSATVTVVDEAAPVIACNAPATIVPPDAPVSFTATAADACGGASAEVVAYDCFLFTKKGKRIDKTGSCEVTFAGDTITITDSGGVGDTITWLVAADDGSGNEITMQCEVEVVNPGHQP
jgi:hypothetical protein